MSESERLSRKFYAALGPEGLAGRTRPEWDAQIVSALEAILPPHARILDVGCGYGRIALPLAERGHRVEGLDLSPVLIAAASEHAEKREVRARFVVGSMRGLPYGSDSFDAVLCLWSSFHELIERDEQLQALAEMWRVAAPGGFVLIEGPLGGTAEGDRVSWDIVEGLPNPHASHDAASFSELCAAVGIDGFSVFEDDWAGRTRLFLRLEKPRA